MKDEIKGIIIDQHWNYIILGNEKYHDLPPRLLDYITNLQEENKRLSVELNKNMIERNNYLSKEKAREYIRTHYLKPTEPELENILTGGDE